MTNKIFQIVSLATIFLLTSCGNKNAGKNVDEGKIKENFYTSQELGWTMEIPSGWTVVKVAENQRINERGLEALQENLGAEVNMDSLKNLISFKKNEFNSFSSTSEPFKLEYEGEWEENDITLKGIVYQTIAQQGIKVDSTATTIESIDGVKFRTYTFTIYGPKGDVILKQNMYSSLINGMDFGVNFNYNNAKDRDELMRVFKNSKFTAK